MIPNGQRDDILQFTFAVIFTSISEAVMSSTATFKI